jgi:hypothetical protein
MDIARFDYASCNNLLVWPNVLTSIWSVPFVVFIVHVCSLIADCSLLLMVMYHMNSKGKIPSYVHIMALRYKHGIYMDCIWLKMDSLFDTG